MERDWHELVSQPKYKMKEWEENVRISMRDGAELWTDICRPDAEGKFPALLSYSCYGKDMNRLPAPPRPSSQLRGTGGHECGMTEYFVPRGYVHVLADCRGTGYSPGQWVYQGLKEQEDGYDLVEWIAKQPWCNGNVGMLGMSYFAVIQYLVASQQPPHLKAIFPLEGATDRYRENYYRGGMLGLNWLHIWRLVPQGSQEPLSMNEFSKDELQRKIRELRDNEDIKAFPFLYMLTIVPHKISVVFDQLMHPYDGPFWWERSPNAKFDKIKIPCHLLSRWNSWSVHLRGAFDAYDGLDVPKRLTISTSSDPVTFDRPWHEHHDDVLRWYDHWLKGIDTGIMDEPPIKILVQGINQWRYEHEWPLARTEWTKFYLREGGLLSETPPLNNERPDSFTNIPWPKPNDVAPCMKYITPPLAQDVEVTGPIALYLYASLTTQYESRPLDATWYVYLSDIDVDGSERLITRGWLRASHREIDEDKSKPYKPFHPHTRNVAIESGEVYEYAVELRETSNVFMAGHRIQLRIQGQGDVQALFNELPNSTEVEHAIHHSHRFLSYMLLPIIPK
jgi:putative CocE/NonD family hydrolase